MTKFHFRQLWHSTKKTGLASWWCARWKSMCGRCAILIRQLCDLSGNLKAFILACSSNMLGKSELVSWKRYSSDLANWMWHLVFCKAKPIKCVTIWPLYPTEDAGFIGEYANTLDAVMADPFMQNIAVAGRYGAGKSSFLRTYFKLRKSNVLWISLASFIASAKLPKFGKQGYDDFARALGNSIVQQMFYTARQDEIPFSRFRRLTRAGVWRYLGVGLFVGCCLLLLCTVAGTPSVFKQLLDNAGFSVGYRETLFIVTSAGATAILAAALFVYDTYKRRGMSLCLGWGESKMAMEENSRESVFNKYIDELIYYFQVLHYDAVVFEDIDRFDDPLVFTRLREINQLLNNTRQIAVNHKPIRFIYAVRDDVFAGRVRTKFFDYILSVVPIINAGNSDRQFWERLNAIFGGDWCSEPYQILVRDVSPFVSDMRLLNNIFNEFAVHRKTLPESLRGECLLAMIVFKNFFPKEYNRIHDNAGLMQRLICQKKLAIDELVKEWKKEINEFEARVRTMDEERYQSILDLNRYFITEAFIPVIAGSGSTHLVLDGTQHKVTDFCNPAAFEKIVGRDFGILRKDSFNCYHQGEIKWVQIEAEAKKRGSASYFERKKLIEDKMSDKRAECTNASSNLLVKIKLVESATFKELVDDYQGFRLKHVYHALGLDDEGLPPQDEGGNRHRIDDLDDLRNGAAVVYNLLADGLLAEDYLFYISLVPNGELELGDLDFVMSAQKGEMRSPEYVLTYPRTVLFKIPAQHFSARSIRNYMLIHELLADAREDEKNEIDKRRTAFLSLLNWEKVPDTFDFSAGYLEWEVSEEAKLRWIKYVAAFGDGYLRELLENSRLSDDQRFVHAGLYLKCFWSAKKQTSVPRFICEYLSKSFAAGKVFKLAGFSPEEYRAFVSSSGLKLGACALDLMEEAGLMTEMLSTNSYAINPYMVESLLRKFGGVTDNYKRSNLTTCCRSAVPGLGRYIWTHFEEYLTGVYDRLVDRQSDAEEDVVRVLNEKEYELTSKRRYMERQDVKLLDAGQISDPAVLQIVIECGNIICSWRNLLLCFAKGGFSDALARLMVRDKDILLQDSPPSDKVEMEGLIESLIASEVIGNDLLLDIFKHMQVNGPIDLKGSSISDRRRKCLEDAGLL